MVNRHRRNWSAMGPGFSEPGWWTGTTEQEYYEMLRPTFGTRFDFASLSNCIKAIRRIDEEFKIQGFEYKKQNKEGE